MDWLTAGVVGLRDQGIGTVPVLIRVGFMVPATLGITPGADLHTRNVGASSEIGPVTSLQVY